MKAIEDEKERKKKAKADKIQAEKAAGTYMTKAEKEKAKRLKERLEAMKQAQGILIPGISQTTPSDMTIDKPTKRQSKDIKIDPENERLNNEIEPETHQYQTSQLGSGAPFGGASASADADADADEGRSSLYFQRLIIQLFSVFQMIGKRLQTQ